MVHKTPTKKHSHCDFLRRCVVVPYISVILNRVLSPKVNFFLIQKRETIEEAFKTRDWQCVFSSDSQVSNFNFKETFFKFEPIE